MRKIIIGIIVLIVALVIYGLYQFNKGPITLENKKADIQLTSGNLLNAFLENENDANTLYLDKIIEVSGLIASINKEGEVVTVKLESEDLMSAVICEMGDGYSNELKEGDQVKIKGQCTGFLMDVILVKCVIKK